MDFDLTKQYPGLFEERIKLLNKAINGKLSVEFKDEMKSTEKIKMLSNNPILFYMHKNRHLLEDYCNESDEEQKDHRIHVKSPKAIIRQNSIREFEGKFAYFNCIDYFIEENK